MPEKKVVILDGTRAEDKHLYSILALLIDVLHEDEGTEVQTFSLRDISLNHCIGCFNCWLKTPGECVHTADAGAEILQAILNSDIVILFTPVVFGGYSSELKKIIDRFLPMVLPFFQKTYTETHHPQRYSTFPALIGIGVHPDPYKEIYKCFKTLVGRNALNLSPPRYAAEVISHKASPQMLRNQFQTLLSRTEKLPWYEEVSSLMFNTTNFVPKVSTKNRSALLIVGSPKVKQPSTSAILGSYLLEKLEKNGWKIELLTLQQSLFDKDEQRNFLSAIERADTILIAFPLYFDTLPFLVTKAFEVIASQGKSAKGGQPKKILAILNNGLPESYQNAVALAICRIFTLECNMIWLGGLAIGAGEALISGQTLTGFKGFRGRLKRPPLFHVTRALNITATALVKGWPIPEKAVRLIAKQPVPLISADGWQWCFIKASKIFLEQEAIKNGLPIQAMFEKPYAE